MLNLGVEGMMLVGAVMGFWAVQRVHATTAVAACCAAILVAAVAGAAMAAIHAFLVITLRASQIVSGLALTIFAGAVGLSSYLGNDLNLADLPADAHVPRGVPGEHAALADRRADRVRAGHPRLHLVGLRRRDLALPVAHAAGSQRPRRRRVAGGRGHDGDQRHRVPLRPHARRRRVRRRRGRDDHARDHAAVGRTGSRAAPGWIAIALVIFAFWRPELCLVGAYFFGALQALAPQLQARNISLGPTVLWTNALPYVMTIVVLVVVSSGTARSRLGAPAALGNAYAREER